VEWMIGVIWGEFGFPMGIDIDHNGFGGHAVSLRFDCTERNR